MESGRQIRDKPDEIVNPDSGLSFPQTFGKSRVRELVEFLAGEHVFPL